MAYERIDKPKGLLYHYTKRENVESILRDGRIRKFKDSECWFCTSLEDTLRLMELTVMQEGKLYFDANGFPRQYPKFVPEALLKLGEEFSHLKAGFRGDLRFYENPNVYEVAELLQEQTPAMQMDM